MAWLLNLFYLLAWLAASPWLLWRRWRWGKNRRGWGQRLLGLSSGPAAGKPRIWLHAVSVGEVNLLAPIVAELSRRGDFEFAISTTTETGFDLAQQKYPQHFVFFAPFDFSWAVQRTLRQLKPKLLVLAELELWPNWIRAAEQMEVPVVVVNGRLSAESFVGYERWRRLVSPMFRRLSLVLAQSEEYASRFSALGTPAGRVFVAGNVKFDNADPRRATERAKTLKDQYDFRADDLLLVGGSTQPDEDRMLLSAFQQLRAEFPQLRLVLVPRHPEKAKPLESVLRGSIWSYQFRSLAKDAESVSRPDVVVVDLIGELAAWWTLATVSYVGGSLGARGGQNMIEPAACGSVVCFGPNTQNFRDVVELLLRNQTAMVLRDEQELIELVRRALKDPAWRQAMGQRAAALVAAQQGAAARTAELICGAMNAPRAAGNLGETRAA